MAKTVSGNRQEIRRGLVKKADYLFSLLIRWRDKKCVICGTVVGLECSHYYGKKARPQLRWNQYNAVAMCHTCHVEWHSGNRQPFDEYMKEWLGSERYENLGRYSSSQVVTVEWLESIVERMKKRCKELGLI